MKRTLIALTLAAGHLAAGATENTIPLAGQWRFQLDRADAGIGERWFERALPDKIRLPGSLAAQGIGDPVSVDTKWTGGIVDKSWFTAPEFERYRQPGKVKLPFWLQPETYYAGAAWFQREIEIPQTWTGKRMVLFLERPHWETRVWVGGQLVGTNHSLSTPHEYDLGQLAPGKHTLTIRVDNRRIVDIGENSHGISDHTQGNWNGIVGKIELRATPLVWIEEVQVFPDTNGHATTVRVQIRNSSSKASEHWLWEYYSPGNVWTRPPKNPIPIGQQVIEVPVGGMSVALTNELGPDIEFWDEFKPALLHLKVNLSAPLPTAGEAFDPAKHRANSYAVDLAFREVSTDGTQITINGRKTFIRGTLECAIFPKTGHPPTDIGEWRRIIRVAKSCGLNLIRFHSWCPPEAAFQAADELGFYFQVETCWPNQSTSLGDGKPVDQWVYDETGRILKAYGNHPSFLLMAHGNEPGGRNANTYLARYVDHYKALDPRRLWTSGSGWPQLPENQFHVTPDPRVQAWGGGLKSRINARPPETATDYRDYISKRSVPVISHEIGQWCVYPNFDEIRKYTGYLKPKNFELFRDTLNANGLGGLAREFLRASGRLQALCYKEDIESALRTPGMGGFELLDLHDFPGQGTALVGVLDPFWEEKGYVTAREYRRFCNSTVPLVRLSKRVFTTEEALTAEIEVAHFGPTPIEMAVPEWKLVDDSGKVRASGALPARTLPLDNGLPLGSVNVALKELTVPKHYRLVVGLAKTKFENDWDVWVYPANPASAPPPNILVTAEFDEAAQAHVRAGGKLLLTIPGPKVCNFDTAPVKLGFSSIFWNTAWTGRQPPTTLGILCDPKHPALAEFPTDFHSNWQWWYLIHRAGALRLDLLPPGIEPIVRVIDDWFTARPLGLVVEGKVGKGKVVVCGFDLTRDADDPVSRQMRASLLRYMDSVKFAPKTELTADQIKSLIAEPKEARLRGVRGLKADSEQEAFEAEKAMDGDASTLWHTAWGELAAGFPHELVIEFDKPRTVAGITALPRQDRNRNGWIKDYAVYVSDDGKTWKDPVAKGAFPASPSLQTVKWATPASGSFLRLVALSGHATGPWASLAELEVLFAE